MHSDQRPHATVPATACFNMHHNKYHAATQYSQLFFRANVDTLMQASTIQILHLCRLQCSFLSSAESIVYCFGGCDAVELSCIIGVYMIFVHPHFVFHKFMLIIMRVFKHTLICLACICFPKVLLGPLIDTVLL